MTDSGDHLATGRTRRAAWLVTGALAGAALTALVVATVARFLEDPSPEAAGAPAFVAETGSGLDHVYDGGFEYFVGGGVAVFDCDADSLPDVYLAGGANEAALYRNESSPAGPLQFDKLEGDATDLGGVTGAYPLDVDNDGITDLAVLRIGENVMLRGLGDCAFERANEAWSVEGGDAWTEAFSATWEDGETRPTFVFGNYLRRDATAGESQCDDHALLRPARDAYADPLVLSPGWCTLSALFSDWSGSGRRDLRMTNDRHYYEDGQEQLWRIEPGDEPRPYGSEDGWERMQIWGMGIASYDVTGDGTSEVLLTSQGDNKLQTLADDSGAPRYEDIAYARGVTAHRPHTGVATLPSTAWHPEFDDVNNDGFVDLFITKGNVEAQESFAADDPNNLLLGGPDGVFTEAADIAGLADTARSRGAAVVDLNGDGMLDVIVVDRREPVKVWRNTGSGTAGEPAAMGRWIEIELHQPEVNGDAVGAWIDVDAGGVLQRREVTIGGGHAGGQLVPIHFGLGTADRASVRVTWPDGEAGPWMDVDADRVVVITRGASEPAG
jgi:hypothetical protein